MKIWGKLFLWWAIPCWVLSCVWAFCCYVVIFNVLPPKRAYRATFRITRTWGRIVLAFLFCRVKIEGVEKLDPKRHYIMVSNHIALVDIPLCQVSAPVPFSFLAKSETLKYPVVGFLVRNMHLPVDRRSEESRRKSFDDMVAHVQNARSVHIYIEGTRNRSDAPLLPFYDGAFRLAIATGVPLAVLAIVGSERVSPPKDSFVLFPFRTVRCKWVEVIDTQGLGEGDLAGLKERVRVSLLQTLETAPPQRVT